MKPTFDAKELQDLLHNLTGQGALTELAVLLGCLGLSWLISAALLRLFKMPGSILFGDKVYDGVMFPVLALLLALLARHAFMAEMKVAVFRLAIPILTSLVVIRLAVRVLSASFPLSRGVRAIERTVSWLAWIAAILWITGVLPVMMAELDGFRWQIGKAEISARNVIEGGLTTASVMVLALWLSAALERKIIRGTGNDLSMRKMIANVLRSVLLLVGVLVAMSALGIDLTALGVLGGALGVGLGFGLQKIAANYVSGFVILAERSLRIGDMVKVDNFEGRVIDIRTRYTVIRALGGREAIVPNEMLITQRVENSSLEDSRVAVSSVVQVAYGTDVRALQPKLIAAMQAVPRVLQDPAPSAQLAGFGADGMNLSLTFWIRDPENGQGGLTSEVHLAVLDVLNAEGIEIPFPQRVMHTKPPTYAGDGSEAQPQPGATG